MPKNLNVICHLEPVGPVYVKDQADFCLSIQLAFTVNDDVDLDKDADFVKPWAADWSNLQVYGLKAGAIPVAIDSKAVTVLTPTDLDPTAITAVQQKYEAVFPQDVEAWKIEKVDATKSRQPLAVDASHTPWLALQGQQSQAAGGVPVLLGLTIFFRIPNTALSRFDEIVAAPSFGTKSPFKTVVAPMTPTKVPTDSTAELVRQADGSYSWSYSSAPTGFAVTEAVNSCPLTFAQPGKDDFLDLLSLWVKEKKSGSTFSATMDWTSEFETRLADAFNLPQRLADALTSLDGTYQAWTGGFASAFVSSLSYAAIGRAIAPDGSTLAETVLRIAEDDDIATRLAQLDTYVANLTDKIWRDRLGNVLHNADPLVYPDPATAIPAVPVAPAEPGDDPLPLKAYGQAITHMRSVLQSPAALREMLLGNWRAAFNTPDDPLQAISGAFDSVDLNKRLLLGVLGVEWPNFSSIMNDTASISAELNLRLIAGTDALFGGVGKTPAPVAKYLSAFAADFAAARLKPQPVNCDSPSTGPEELVLQVADLRRVTEGADNVNDPLRRIAGVGVLLKSDKPTSWSCLNLATVEADGKQIGTMPIPVKLQYRNGMRQAFVPYKNQPLISESPAHEFAKQGGFAASGPSYSALLDYRNPYVEGGPRLEGLFYGRTYQSAIFLFGTGGNLPSEIADPAAPWKFKPPVDTATIPQQPAVKFLRGRLGAVRIAPSSDPKANGLTSSRMPDNVRPLARSIQRQTDKIQDGESLPLILLLPPKPGGEIDIWNRNLKMESFSFLVRPPSAEMPVWFSWVGKDGNRGFSPDECAAILDEHAERNDTIPRDPGEQPTPANEKRLQPDGSLDDPAVNQLIFSMELIAGTSDPVTDLPCPVLKNPDKRNLLARAQSLSRGVVVQTKDTGSATMIISAEDNHVAIEIPAGTVWRLRIRPSVTDTTLFQVPACVDGSTKPSLGEVSILLEAAADWPRNKDEKHPETVERISMEMSSALLATFTSKPYVSSQSLSDSLDVNLVLDPKYKWLSLLQHIDVLTQQWRWDGRPPFSVATTRTGNGLSAPTFGYPAALSSIPDSDGPFDLDAVLFANRLPSDRAESPKEIDFPVPVTGKSLLYREDLSSDTRSNYYRMAMQATSRYAGLMTLGQTISSIGTTGPDRWNRVQVPGRWTQPVPRPAVKLVVPLTATWNAIGKDKPELTPGLMVMLDEPWYASTFGMAEYLECDIEEVLLPQNNGDSRLQFGPDPLLNLNDDPFAGKLIELPPAVGAMGYTFDRQSQSPKWVRSSFYQPPPTIDGNPAGLAWHFVKLRFRRTLASKAMDANRRPASLQSDWTPGVWTQLLPPVDKITGTPFPAPGVPGVKRLYDISELEFTPDYGVRENGTGIPVQLVAPGSSDDNCQFSLYLLITRAVSDIAGRPEQEAAVENGLVPLDNKIWPAPASAAATPAWAAARLRVIEIQHRSAETIDPIDVALFTPAVAGVNPTDAKARISRVWLPIVNAVS